MINPLDQLSGVLLISAMAVYAAAFIAFAFDLARRSSEAQAATGAAVPAARATRQSGGTLLAEAPPAVTAPPRAGRRSSARIGITLTVLGLVLHIGADVLRGVAAGRVPWANMYEFSMTGTLLMVAVFLIALTRVDLRWLGAVITGLVLVLLGIATVGFKVAVSPLPPALQSYWPAAAARRRP